MKRRPGTVTMAGQNNKTQIVVVESKTNNTLENFKGNAFNARYNLQTTTQQGSKTSYFVSFIKFFSQEKVEVKRSNQLPIFLLNYKFAIDKDSKKGIDKQISIC